MMSLVRAQLGEPKTRYKLIGVDDAEGPPVPIPNTEVKLSGAEDSALATRCENREMPILVASFPLSNEADFYSRLFYFANYTFFIHPFVLIASRSIKGELVNIRRHITDSLSKKTSAFSCGGLWTIIEFSVIIKKDK